MEPRQIGKETIEMVGSVRGRANQRAALGAHRGAPRRPHKNTPVLLKDRREAPNSSNSLKKHLSRIFCAVEG